MEEILVEAEIVEETTDLEVTVATPEISDNLAALSAHVDEALEPYVGWVVDVSDRKRIAEAKKVLAQLPKLKKRIDAERIRVKKAYTAPLEAWEKRVHEVTNRIETVYREVKGQIDAAEQASRDARREHLIEVYEEFAPALVPMVPFERFEDRKWMRISMNEKAAEAELCDRVAKIARDWDVLKASNLRCPQESEVEFFRTLDLQAALAFDTEHAEEIERLNDLKAEVEPEPEPRMSDVDGVYRFTIEIPRTEFVTSVIEATALKNHLAQFGIKAAMTKSRIEVAA